MGEPLSNFDNLADALEIITSHRGLEIGARHITISTSGFVPGLKKLAAYPRQIRLAVSLHGATDEVRDQIMPVNKNGRSPSSFRPLRNGTGKKPDAHAGIHSHQGHQRFSKRRVPSRPDRQTPRTPKSISSRTTPWRGSRGNALRKNAAVPSGMQFTRRASPLPCGMKRP